MTLKKCPGAGWVPFNIYLSIFYTFRITPLTLLGLICPTSQAFFYHFVGVIFNDNCMTIYPIRTEKGLVYACDKVITTVGDKREVVSEFGYFGKSRADVIKQAVGNAMVKRWRAQLATAFRMLPSR